MDTRFEYEGRDEIIWCVMGVVTVGDRGEAKGTRKSCYLQLSAVLSVLFCKFIA